MAQLPKLRIESDELLGQGTTVFDTTTSSLAIAFMGDDADHDPDHQ